MSMMRLVILILLIFPVAAFAQGSGGQSGGSGCEEARTEFFDVSVFGRKDRAAGNMTKRHAEMATKGWRFTDMEVYTENNDLEGFYVTYVRTVACGTTSN